MKTPWEEIEKIKKEVDPCYIKKEKNILLIIASIFTIVISFTFIFPYINSRNGADYYNNLSSNNIKYIEFYEHLYKKSLAVRGRLLVRIDSKNDIKKFLSNYWGDIDIESDRAWGKKFWILIKKTNGIDIIEAGLSSSGFVRIYTKGHLKSYKLYKFFKFLEEKLKLKNTRE